MTHTRSRASCSSFSVARCDWARMPKWLTAPALGAVARNMKSFTKDPKDAKPKDRKGFVYTNGQAKSVVMASQGSEGLLLPWAYIRLGAQDRIDFSALRKLTDIVSDCLRLSQICAAFAHLYLQITGQGSALGIVEHDAWTKVTKGTLKLMRFDAGAGSDQFTRVFSSPSSLPRLVGRIPGCPMKDFFPLKLPDHFYSIVFQGGNSDSSSTFVNVGIVCLAQLLQAAMEAAPQAQRWPCVRYRAACACSAGQHNWLQSFKNLYIYTCKEYVYYVCVCVALLSLIYIGIMIIVYYIMYVYIYILFYSDAMIFSANYHSNQ